MAKIVGKLMKLSETGPIAYSHFISTWKKNEATEIDFHAQRHTAHKCQGWGQIKISKIPTVHCCPSKDGMFVTMTSNPVNLEIQFSQMRE